MTKHDVEQEARGAYAVLSQYMPHNTSDGLPV